MSVLTPREFTVLKTIAAHNIEGGAAMWDIRDAVAEAEGIYPGTRALVPLLTGLRNRGLIKRYGRRITIYDLTIEGAGLLRAIRQEMRKALELLADT